MAHIETRDLAKGRRSYIVRWREPGTGKKCHKVFHRSDDARRYRNDLERQMDMGDYVSSDLRSTPFGEYAKEVLKADWGLRDSTRYGYEHYLSKWITPTLGDEPIGKITTSQLRGFFADIEASDVVKASVYRLLAKVFNQALRDGILSKSPLAPISRPRPARKEIHPIDPSLVRLIAEEADPRYRVPILLAGFAGLRAGEVGGLHWKDVDVAGGTLSIRQAVRQVGPKRVLGDVKTGSSRRRVKVPGFLLQELLWHARGFPPIEDRVFSTEAGGLVSHNVLLRRFQSACKAADQPKMRFHDLRHSCASLLIREGAHPKMVQAYLGHANISITLDIYGHLFPSVADELADRLDRVWVQTDAVRRIG